MRGFALGCEAAAASDQWRANKTHNPPASARSGWGRLLLDEMFAACQSVGPMLSLRGPLDPLQRRRLELNIALMPVYVWLIFAWTAYAIDISPAGKLDRAGHIKGHDFAHFYVLGQIANDRSGKELYSFEQQATRMDRLVPEYQNRFLPVYGPQVAMLFAPLARLPYTIAVACWLAATVIIYGTCCYAIWRMLPALHRYRWESFAVCAAFPPFYSLVASGHITALPLACCTAAFFAFRAKRELAAGFLLGLLFLKPALGLILPFVFFYNRAWRLIAGAMIAVLLQLAAAALLFGVDVLASYWNVVTQLGATAGLLEPHPYEMHSLRSFFSILLPWPRAALVAYVISAALVVWLALAVWRTDKPHEIRYSVLLIAMVLVDPHVNAYDLVIIAPALLVSVAVAVVDASPSSRALLWLVYAVYFFPALPAIAEYTRIQASVPMLVAIVYWLHRRNCNVTAGLKPRRRYSRDHGPGKHRCPTASGSTWRNDAIESRAKMTERGPMKIGLQPSLGSRLAIGRCFGTQT